MFGGIKINRRAAAIIIGVGLLLLTGCGGQTTPKGLAAVSGAPLGVSETRGYGESALSRGTGTIGGATTNVAPIITAQGMLDTGIRASGQGQVSGTPDLAVLNMGIESFSATVVDARSEAADAMEDVLEVLRDSGIANEDIQTRFFNIHPRYTSREVTRCIEKSSPDNPSEQECFPQREQIISGYEISNQLTVIVRELEAVSGIIDQVIEAGGNLIRFQGVNFTIENTRSLQEQARAAAVADLMDKAGQLASSAGVELGSLIFIEESSHTRPWIVEEAASRAYDMVLSQAASPILPGQQSLTVTVQGVFSIQ